MPNKHALLSAVAAAVRKAGYNPYERKLLSVTAMRELLGNRQFITLLGRMTGRTKGAPILVPENDKRPEYAPADHFFKEEEES